MRDLAKFEAEHDLLVGLIWIHHGSLKRMKEEMPSVVQKLKEHSLETLAREVASQWKMRFRLSQD